MEHRQCIEDDKTGLYEINVLMAREGIIGFNKSWYSCLKIKDNHLCLTDKQIKSQRV